MEVKEFGNEEIAYLIGYNECSSCGFKSTCINTIMKPTKIIILVFVGIYNW